MATLPIYITTYGLLQLAGGTFEPDRLVLGDGVPGAPHDQDTTALTNVLKTLISPGDVVQFTAQEVGDDVRLHCVSFDDSSDAYSLREFALADATGALLAVYGEGIVVAAKGVAALHFEFDVTLANAAPGDVVIGPTAYLLPPGTQSQAGVVQLTTVAEASAGLATDRAVNPTGLHAALDILCASTWCREASGLPASDVRGLAHDGARRWVAVGEAGLIATSDDQGETWTVRTPDASYSGRFSAVCYAAGLFVAVGQSAEVQTSPDGETWTSRNSAAGPTLEGVAYDGTEWVAVGVNSGAGYVLTAASAATTWSVQTAPTFTTALQAVASDGAGLVVAVGDRASSTLGQISVSTDHGVTWTSEEAPTGVGTLRAVTRGADGVFYAGGEGGDIVSSSAPVGAPGSSDWTTLRSASGPAIYGIAAPGGGCVVASRGGLTVDPADPVVGHATTWRTVQAPTSEGAFGAHYGAGRILIGLDGGGVLRSLVFGHRL